MLRPIILKIAVLGLLLFSHSAVAQNAFELLAEVTQRYAKAQGFCIEYSRELRTRSMSMLGAQARGDIAEGKIYVMPPHYMRLEQTNPREEFLITDGKTLWWYIPKEKKAYLYPAKRFGRQIRLIGEILSASSGLEKKFKARVVEDPSQGGWLIELKPLIGWEDLDHIVIHITKAKEIVGLEMVNPLGSKTIFRFNKIEKAPDLDPSQFQFTIPEGVTLIREE